VFSARAIEADAWAAVHRGCDSVSRGFFASSPNGLLPDGFPGGARRRRGGRGDCLPGIYNLSAALADCCTLRPGIVILADRWPTPHGSFDSAAEEVWSRSRGLLGRDVPIVEQQVGDKSGIIGAAGLALSPRS